MKELINILDFLPEELEEKIKPMFRVKQIYQWIYQKYANNFSDMSSLPKDLRLELAQTYHFSPLKCVKMNKAKMEVSNIFLNLSMA